MRDEELKRVLEAKLDAKTRELEELREKMYKDSQRLQLLMQEVEGFKHALASVNRDLGLSEESQPGDFHQVSADTMIAPEGMNKTEFILDTIRKSGNQGVTVKEIITALKVAGITAHENYPYAIVNRLKKQSKVREKNGRYSIA